MKQTNYYLYDFLDFIPGFEREENLWRACKPVDIEVCDKDVFVTIPFRRQLKSLEIIADRSVPPISHRMRIRAYGSKIIRISISLDVPVNDDSAMLEIRPELGIIPLHVEKDGEQWFVRDSWGTLRAVFNLQEPETDHWSDLLPAPEETLQVTFLPDGMKEVKISAYDQFKATVQDAMALAFVSGNDRIDRTTMAIHADPDECFAGTGERFSKMDLSGKTFRLINQDANGVNNRRAYKNIPFYLSSRDYGLFIHTSAYTKLSLADHSSRSVQFLTEEGLIDIFIIGGDTPEEILFNYRRLTGFPSMPPLWSFGTWMSRMSYFSAEEVTGICKRLRDEDFPCDVIHLDTGWFRKDWLCEWKFNEERFPDSEKFICQLKKQGFRVSLWQLPYVARGAEQLTEALANNYICENKQITQGSSDFSATDYAGTIDFTYDKAVEWYKGLLRKLLEMGVKCIKTDFGEDITLDGTYHGMEARLLHNLYPLLYQKAAFEITKEVTGTGIIWARSAWAGAQRYPVHWGGDSACSWDGMAGSLKGGLHLGLSGFGFWSHDVPGFHGFPDFMNQVIPEDLYLRWTQFGVFTSHLRYHGTSKREPWHFPVIAPIVRKWLKLRYCLIPYLLEQSETVVKTGFPLLRALIFNHPADKMCWHISDEYYCGNYFLVAPLMNSENKRDVYLPEGRWVNFFNGKKETGGKWLKDYPVPPEEMPVWVKWGARIPVYPEAVNCTDEMDFNKVIHLNINVKFHGIRNTEIGVVCGFDRNK